MAKFGALAVLALWVGSGPVLYFFFGGQWTTAGTFGDSFGAVNSLFSGLALIGLVYAIRLQLQELEDTRKELKSQQRSIDVQSFENTFFQLLKLQADIVNAIDLDLENGQRRSGRDCFRTFHWHLQNTRKELVLDGGDEETAVGAYLVVYKRFEGDLGHYFRSLYHIIKFVDRGPEFIEDKRRYTNFVRAQLSSFELVLLFYNGLSPLGVDKMKPLIEKYALLKNVSKNRLLAPDHVRFYSPSAFQGSGPDLDAIDVALSKVDDEGLTT